MADRETLWGWDIDDSPADVDESRPGNGYRDPITEPIPVVETGYDLQDVQYDEQDDYRDESPPGYHDEGESFSYAETFVDRRSGSPASTLTFKSAPQPWYRTRRGLLVLLAVLAVAVILAIIPLVLRGSDSGTDQAPSVTPSTSAPSSQPTENTVAPTLSSFPAPPPPPPPPPAPPSEESPPAVTRQYSPPRYNTPSEPEKPQVDVTRAPMSVAPEQRTAPSTAVPDGKPRRGFF